MRVPINEIRVGKRLRALRETAVVELVDSIGKLGLQVPISVTTGIQRRHKDADRASFELVAGHHRLEACKRLDWQEIEAQIVQLNDDQRALWEIDENLCRAELTELERGEHLRKRKEIYEALYPETKRGANREPDGQFVHTEHASFAEDTAQKVGVTDRDIRRSIRRVSKIDEKVRDRIRDNPEIADSGVELDTLASLTPDQQRKAVGLVESGKAAGIRDAKRLIEPKPLSKEAQIRALREQKPAVVRPPAVAPTPTDDVNALQSLLLTLRADPRRIAGIPLEKRVSLARTCLAWLNVTLTDLRAP